VDAATCRLAATWGQQAVDVSRRQLPGVLVFDVPPNPVEIQLSRAAATVAHTKDLDDPVVETRHGPVSKQAQRRSAPSGALDMAEVWPRSASLRTGDNPDSSTPRDQSPDCPSCPPFFASNRSP
jgi:hypothetical protein